MADALPPMVAAIPLRRAATTEEVAHAILYLSGETSSYITGAVVPVDGGRTSAL